MLGNNLNMMSFELTKICKTFKINDFKKDKISTYPEEAQARLTLAEQTLNEFKEFLKTEKYKEWNDEQVSLFIFFIVVSNLSTRFCPHPSVRPSTRLFLHNYILLFSYLAN